MPASRAGSGTPAPGEWSPYHLGYLSSRLPGLPGNEGILGGLDDDAQAYLERQLETLQALSSLIPAERELHRYAPGKWTVRQLLGHLSDAERILSFRALVAARGDRTSISPFDEEMYAAGSGHDAIPLADLVDELVVVRRSTLAMVRSWNRDQWCSLGVVSGHPVSARAWLFVIAVHADLHLDTLRTKYLA